MPIISSTNDIKKHVAIAASLQFPDIEPYIGQAVDQFTYRYVGPLQETLAEEAPAGPDKANIDRARHLLQNALSNFALFIYVPMGSIMFDSSGMSNADNDKRTPITWQQANDIRRGMLTAGHTAMDLLLSHLEEYKDLFPEWRDSQYYTQTKELLVNSTRVFDMAYHIYDSRQTYLALIPSMRQVEDKYIDTLLCPELISHLKEQEYEGVKGKVKTYLQKAVVAFTVAKVANEGFFLISGSGLRLKFDSLSTDRVQPVDAAFLKSTTEAQEANGRNYLSLAKKLIIDNPAEFNQCDNPIILADAGGSSFPYNKGGVLAL